MTGASGQLGGYLLREWQRSRPAPASLICVARTGFAIPGGDVRTLDLTDMGALEALLPALRPTKIFHLAGLTQPSQAEQNPDLAALLNQQTTRVLARYAARANAWLLYTSTDFVFAGDQPGWRTEEDPTEPATAYGLTKLGGEREVLAHEAGAVLRLSMLWGDVPSGEGRGWAVLTNRLRQNLTVRGIVDETRTPMHFAEAAKIIARIGQLEHRGLLHVAGKTAMSPYQIIMRMRDELGSRSEVVPILRKDYCPGLDRPRNVALDTSRLAAVLSEREIDVASAEVLHADAWQAVAAS